MNGKEEVDLHEGKIYDEHDRVIGVDMGNGKIKLNDGTIIDHVVENFDLDSFLEGGNG